MRNRLVRVGIDVRGAHIKAAAINNATYEIIGKSSVKTTRDDRCGMAVGVVKAFQNCLRKNDIAPEGVISATHSTIQAANTLIEGDTAYIGVLGMGPGGVESFLAKHQTHPKDIDLGSGRSIWIKNRYSSDSEEGKDTVRKAVEESKIKDAQVLVASDAYRVNDVVREQFVFEIVRDEVEMETTVISGITELYGLTRRTRTAAINAGILTKILNTANPTEESVRKAGVGVPLMIMRGDNGVAGSLMYLRVSNDVYFEVGGTTTNTDVIRNGCPAIDYSVVGRHRIYISSPDVRTPSVTGEGMTRANKSGIRDIGPHSVHIAGLDYAGFTDEDEIIEPRLEFFSPREGIPRDYVAIRLKSDKHIIITSSYVANMLGLAAPKDFFYGNVNAARKAMWPVADCLYITMEDVAARVLTRAYGKIGLIIMELDDKYCLEHDQMSLAGVGDGTASLIGLCANKMNIKHGVPESAEAISSIGVALIMVRDMAKWVTPNLMPEDIRSVK